MKIAVTGAGHFIGARLIESFHLGGGPTIAAVVAHPSELTAAARFAIDLRVADFLAADSLARSFAGCSCVVQVAPLVQPDAKQRVAALCRAAAQSAVKRIILVSSVDVHGLCPRPGTDEHSPFPGRHDLPAASALVAGERQFASDCRRLGLAGFTLRAGFLYGPRSAFIAALALALEAGIPPPAASDGISNCLYVDNLIAAIRLGLKTKTAPGAVFFVTDGAPVTWRAFFTAAAAELRTPGPSAVPGLPAKTRAGAPLTEIAHALAGRERCTWRAPGERAQQVLGYEPAVSFAEGIRRSFAWWRFAQGRFPAAA